MDDVARPEDLPGLLAHSARALESQDDLTATMQTAVDIAVRDIEGADAAALSIIQRKKVINIPAASNRAARYGDELQYELGEGPCLDAVWENPLVEASDLDEEPRWPRWAPRMVREAEFRSMNCVRLLLTDRTVGALNLYSRTPHGFSDDDREHSIALAAHIAVAIRSSQPVDQLRPAVDARTVIGQATGILMERSDLDAFNAFTVLTTVASQLERRVADVAEEFVITRRLPGTPPGTGRPERESYRPPS